MDSVNHHQLSQLGKRLESSTKAISQIVEELVHIDSVVAGMDGLNSPRSTPCIVPEAVKLSQSILESCLVAEVAQLSRLLNVAYIMGRAVCRRCPT